MSPTNSRKTTKPNAKQKPRNAVKPKTKRCGCKTGKKELDMISPAILKLGIGATAGALGTLLYVNGSAPVKKGNASAKSKPNSGEKAAKTRARNKERLKTVEQLRVKAYDAYEKNCPRMLKGNPSKIIEDEDELLDRYREKHNLGYDVPNETVIKKLTNKEFSEYKEGMHEVINQAKHPDEYNHYDILMPYGRTAKVRRL